MAGRTKGLWAEKPYRDALRMEIAAAGEADDPHAALRKIARRHLNLAAGGDMQAIKELADRLDGKPAQETTAEVTHTYEKIVREIVHPENKDGTGLPTTH